MMDNFNCLSVATKPKVITGDTDIDDSETTRLSNLTDIDLLKVLATRWCKDNGYKLGGYLGWSKSDGYSWDATKK